MKLPELNPKKFMNIQDDLHDTGGDVSCILGNIKASIEVMT